MISTITYNGDGVTRIFPVAFEIKGEEYTVVYVGGVAVADRSLYDIINNSIVFNTAPVIGTNNVEIVVASATTEIADLNAPPSTIQTILDNMADINAIAATVVPNIDEILLVDNNATIATTKASEASTSASQALASKNLAVTSAGNALVSEQSADASEAQALSYKNSAEASATTATTQAGIATTKATEAANLYDMFDDRMLGAKATDPSVDNDGNALVAGTLYFNTTANLMKVYSGTVWANTGSSVQGILAKQTYTATAGQTTFAITYDLGFVDVYVNGVRLSTSDFTATNGTSIVLGVACEVGDIVECQSFGTFVLSNMVSKTGDTMTGNLVFASGTKIRGDFSSEDLNQYTVFQTNALNKNTFVGIIPNGTALVSGLVVYPQSSDLGNSGRFIFQTTSTEASIKQLKSGTGSYTPITFYTAGEERLRIDTAGNVLVTGSGGLGYGTGSGGTVTQLTSKSTAVTLNKPCGQITMNNASLAAGASVVFLFNNSLLFAADTIVFSCNNNPNYSVEQAYVSSGSCGVRVTNKTGGALAEALIISFTVVKGVYA